MMPKKTFLENEMPVDVYNRLMMCNIIKRSAFTTFNYSEGIVELDKEDTLKMRSGTYLADYFCVLADVMKRNN